MQRIFIILSTIISLQLYATPNLKPSIGVTQIPADIDSACYIPLYLGSFYTSGLQKGDTAFDFTLYDLNGDSLNLQTALSNGRPVLLIASSYTCPVYRGIVPVINDIVTSYNGLLDVYIIYTLEAHPYLDTSVYFGSVHTGTPNIQAGILYRQPTTYGERKLIVTDMLDSMTTLARVFIDGPCNNWWNTYGPAPNNSYLIDTNGIVVSKHGWFNRYPDNIYCDIDSLLGTSSGNCNPVSGVSNYTFHYTSSDTVYDIAGTTISVDAEITNTGTQDILIYARKIENDLPAGWTSSMCIDVCYSSSTDSVVFLLPAGVTQPVHVYFYTSPFTQGMGHVKMGFKNLNDTTNKNFMHAFGITTGTTTIIERPGNNFDYQVYPNPVNDLLKINLSGISEFQAEIIDIFGKSILVWNEDKDIDMSSMNAGLYFIRINDKVKKFIKN